MYYVYNEAGKDHGPFTLEQLRAGVASGSLDLNKLVRSDASEDGWKPVHIVLGLPKSKNYWIRVNGSSPFLGPFSPRELRAAIRDGQVPKTSEYVEATGQSLGTLRKETNWRPVSDLDFVRSVDARRHAESVVVSPDFPALQLIASLLKVLAAVTCVLGSLGLVAGLTRTNGTLVIAALAWTLLVPLSLWATAEVVLVLLQIEKNTRQTMRSAVVRARETEGVTPKAPAGGESK